MTIRTVTGTILTPNGSPLTSGLVVFELTRGSYTTSATYIPRRTSAMTDSNGQFSVELWCNAEGIDPSLYRCKLPDGDMFNFVLSPGSSVTIQSLRAAATSGSGSGQWAITLQSLIDNHADVVAGTAVLGHVRVDGATITIDGDGVISSAGGGAVDSVNGQSGTVVLSAAQVGAYSTSQADTLLAAKAPLASPSLTGTPLAPTAANVTSNTQIATTAFVHSLITDIINASPSALDTLKELADAIGSDPNFATTVATSIATRLARASNLSDLTSVATARNNLGLGALALLNTITVSLISDASANGRSLIAATDYAAMRVLLGLVIGTNVQAWNSNLDALAGLTLAADKLAYSTGPGALSLTTLSSFIRTLLDDTDAATARTTLGASTAFATGRPKLGSAPSLSIPGVEGSTAGTSPLSANQIRYEPFEIATPKTLDQLVCEVTSVGAAATTIRLAIYNADTDEQPTSLVVDAGTVAADSLGVKSAAVSVTLPPGRYLKAINSDGTPTVRSMRAGSRTGGYPAGLGANLFNINLTVASAYGAYASTGVAYTAIGSGTTPFVHTIWLRESTP